MMVIEIGLVDVEVNTCASIRSLIGYVTSTQGAPEYLVQYLEGMTNR